MNAPTLWHRLVALVRRRRLDRDLDEELAFHLAMREADYREHGATEADVRAAARRQFGNVAYLKEQCRDMWTFHPLGEAVALRQPEVEDDRVVVGGTGQEDRGFAVSALSTAYVCSRSPLAST